MKRHLMQHLIDINMDTTFAKCDYHLLGEGIDSLTEEFNGDEETMQWINEENGTTDLKSYTPSIEVERQNVDQEDTDLTDWINTMLKTLPTGKNAVTSYLRVIIDPAAESHVYEAVRRLCTVTMGSTGGDAGGNVTDSFTLGGRGDGVVGTYNADTGEFTAGSSLSS